MGRTKDEKFLIASLKKNGEIQEEFPLLDSYEIGTSLGLSPKAVNTICQGLAQANLIKKEGKTQFFRFTERGFNLAKEIALDQ